MNCNIKEGNSRGKIKISMLIKIMLISILLITVLFFLVKLNKNGWNKKGMIMTTIGQEQEDIENLDPIYCLVMGVSQDISSKLTDTIMLCAYYPKSQQVSLLSIPRDTFVGKNQNVADSYDKINALYQKGPEKTIEAVENITGLDINYYVVINNNALIDVVDTIGGIYFEVPIDMDYDDTSQKLHIHLKQGYQLIDGEKAEQLLRFRHNNNNTTYPSSYGTQDIGRMRTQREFMTEAVKQVLQTKDINKLINVVKIVFNNVETNVNLADILEYVPSALEFNIENMHTEVLPGVAKSLKPHNLSFYLYNKTETEKIVNIMFKFHEEEI